MAGGSDRLEVFRRRLAALRVALLFVRDLLTLVEAGQARTLHGGDMDEHDRPAGFRLDEAITLGGIEVFDVALVHLGFPWKGAFRSATCRPATFGALKKLMAGRAGPATARDGSEAYANDMPRAGENFNRDAVP